MNEMKVKTINDRTLAKMMNPCPKCNRHEVMVTATDEDYLISDKEIKVEFECNCGNVMRFNTNNPVYHISADMFYNNFILSALKSWNNASDNELLRIKMEGYQTFISTFESVIDSMTEITQRNQDVDVSWDSAIEKLTELSDHCKKSIKKLQEEMINE